MGHIALHKLLVKMWMCATGQAGDVAQIHSILVCFDGTRWFQTAEVAARWSLKNSTVMLINQNLDNSVSTQTCLELRWLLSWLSAMVKDAIGIVGCGELPITERVVLKFGGACGCPHGLRSYESSLQEQNGSFAPTNKCLLHSQHYPLYSAAKAVGMQRSARPRVARTLVQKDQPKNWQGNAVSRLSFLHLPSLIHK